jgi:hypothetical protein
LTERPALGELAPTIDLMAIEPGATEQSRWRLQDHRGRAVLLIFHRHIH